MTVLQELESGIFKAAASYIEANAATVEGYVATAESDVKAGLANLFKNAPAVKGPAGLIANPVIGEIEAAIEAYVSSYLAKLPPAQVVTLVVAYLNGLAAKV